MSLFSIMNRFRFRCYSFTQGYFGVVTHLPCCSQNMGAKEKVISVTVNLHYCSGCHSKTFFFHQCWYTTMLKWCHLISPATYTMFTPKLACTICEGFKMWVNEQLTHFSLSGDEFDISLQSANVSLMVALGKKFGMSKFSRLQQQSSTQFEFVSLIFILAPEKCR